MGTKSIEQLAKLACVAAVLSSCQTQPAMPPESGKGLPDAYAWPAYPEIFVQDLRVGSMAVTPTRMLVTTLGTGVDKIVELSESGDIQTFTFDFTADPEERCQVEIASGHHVEFPVGEVFVSRGHEVWRFDSFGNNATLVASLAPPGLSITGMCFDHVGAFDFGLLLLASDGSVHCLPGPGLPLVSLGEVGHGGCGIRVASPLFGSYAGHLLIAFPKDSSIRAMDPHGNVQTFVGWSGASAACALPDRLREFGRSQGALFVASESSGILRFPLSQLASYAGDLIVASLHRSGNGLVSPQGSLYTSKAFSRFMGSEICASPVQPPAITQVPVDVTPEDPANQVTMGSNELLPVGILSTSYFSASSLDLSQTSLAGAAPRANGRYGLGFYNDIDDDGLNDVTLYFYPADMQLSPGSMSVEFVSRTYADEAIHGTDQIFVDSP